jgi:hypothetical protein
MFAASKSGRAIAAGAATDPYFNQTVLLLNDTGTNGAQNNTFIDSSTNNFSITRNGNATQGSVNPYEPTGYWSGNFSGSSQYLTVSTNSAFTYGVSDFTIECWVFLTTTGALQYIIDQRNSGTANAVIPAIYVSASNVLTYFVSNAAQITGTTALVIGTWYHVAVSRGTLSTKMFLNGTQEGSTYVDANNYAASRVVISSNAATAGNYLTGFISNVRLVNGTAVYTSAFTPATTPLTVISGTSLLTLQNNRFKDNSSNNFTITVTGTPPITSFSPFAPTASYSGATYGGTMYLDGNGDYLTTSGANLAAGTGDFTWECWVYVAGTSAYQTFIDSRNGTANSGLFIGLSTGTLTPIIFNQSTLLFTSSINIVANAWNHVALVRNSGTIVVYINGVSGGSLANSYTLSSTTYGIGSYYSPSSNNLNGYLSNLRIVNGTAVYTSAFTPPTAPLTAITNTQLLLNATNAGIYDATALNDMETVGNAQVSTTQAKWGASSMAFNGTTDYLKYPPSNFFAFGTADFTIEGWVYLGSTNCGIFQIYSSYLPGTVSGLSFEIANLYGGWSLNYGATNQIISTTTGSTSTWYHFAVVRSSGVIKAYVNGTSIISATDTTNYTYTYLLVGGYYSTSYLLNGYLEDFRITKGVARYTANFTPPTAAFPTR